LNKDKLLAPIIILLGLGVVFNMYTSQKNTQRIIEIQAKNIEDQKALIELIQKHDIKDK